LPLPEIRTEWADYYRNVLKTIDGQEELIVKPEQAMRVMKVMEACFASSLTGQTLDVNIPPLLLP
ncbi:MAG TPA: hypothetical protein DD727_03205, partial [Clostridiales bacterium]|nr:hypothetical protein [Clostridiales bacterium]